MRVWEHLFSYTASFSLLYFIVSSVSFGVFLKVLFGYSDVACKNFWFLGKLFPFTSTRCERSPSLLIIWPKRYFEALSPSFCFTPTTSLSLIYYCDRWCFIVSTSFILVSTWSFNKASAIVNSAFLLLDIKLLLYYYPLPLLVYFSNLIWFLINCKHLPLFSWYVSLLFSMLIQLSCLTGYDMDLIWAAIRLHFFENYSDSF